MNDLIELISLCPPDKKIYLKKIIPQFNENSKTGKLYFGIASGEIRSDDQAIKAIYGSAAESHKYFKLKQRLVDTLLQAILLKTWSEDGFKNYREAFCTSHLKHAIVKILLAGSARSPAVALEEKYIQYSMKYEITHLTFSLASDLRNHYGILALNKRKFLKYDNLCEETEKIMAAESLAAQTLSNFNFIEPSDWESENTERVLVLKRNLSRLDRLFPELNSYRFLLNYCALKTKQYQHENKFGAIIPVAQKCLDLISQKKFMSEIAFYTFNRRLAESYFNTGNIPKAIEKISAAERNTRRFTNNWYISRYFKALFFSHTGEYQRAATIESDTFDHREFNIINPVLKEFWFVLRTYIHFLRTINKVASNKNTFNLPEFLANIPLYKRDKKGRNVAILLVQLLFMLANRDYDGYIDRLDALNQYRRRYLSEPYTFRANCIIRMMTKVGKYSFHPLRVRKYTEKDLAKLKSTPPRMIGSPAEVEIIRYEDMWLMVLDLLEENYRKIHC